MKAALLAILLAIPVAAQNPEVGRAGAPLNPREFRYMREIRPAGPGLVVLTLDTAALSHSSLDDLRIADSRGNQIPYLREESPDPIVFELAVPKRVEEDGDPRGLSRYRLRLPDANLPSARLYLDTPADVFERTVRVEGPQSPRGRPRWRTPETVWRDDDPQKPALPLRLDLPARPGEFVDLLVDEGDNAPLPLGQARLHLDTWRLLFFHPGSGESKGKGVRLLYGHDRLGPPRYDLTLLASRIDSAQAREAVLAPEPPHSRASGASGEQTPRGLFWGALVVAVVVLLGLMARLIREESG